MDAIPAPMRTDPACSQTTEDSPNKESTEAPARATPSDSHMMNSGERKMAAGMAKARVAAKLAQKTAVFSAPACRDRPSRLFTENTVRKVP